MADEVHKYERVWQSAASPPDLAEFLSQHSAADDPVLLRELVKIDIDHRWRLSLTGGEFSETQATVPKHQLRLEDYFSQLPDLGSLEKCPHDLIAHEYCVRAEMGDEPVLDEYLNQFEISHAELSSLIEAEQSKRPAGETLTIKPNSLNSGEPDLSTQPPRRGRKQSASQPQSSSQPTSQFGEYDLLDEIARGGMGVVYKARQRKANRIVALKMILAGHLAGEEDLIRFQLEAEAAASLDHPNIVPLYDVGEAEGHHYFSMAFIDGESLSEVVRDQPLEPRHASRIMLAVAEAVEYAHQKKIVHRDLKPANILIDADGTPRITDFGLAKRIEADSSQTATGQIMGTPSYMPPEQALGKTAEIGTTSDVYSLGAVFYHLVTGRAPFRAASAIGTLGQVVNQEPVSVRQLNPAIDLDLDTIILKSLQKKPAERYASAQEFADDIQYYLDDRPITARRISKFERAWRWSKRNRLAAGFLATILLTIIATIALTSSASIIYRNMAAEEKGLREEMSENLYLSEMNLADDVLLNSELQQATSDSLMHWYPGNPSYLKRVPDLETDWREWEWYFLLGVVDRNRIGLPGQCNFMDVSSQNLMGFGFDKNFAVIKFNQDHGGVTWNAHPSQTIVVKFSPEGDRIATGGLDGTVNLWDVQSREKLTELSHAAPVRSLSFNQDGGLLVTHCEDAQLRIWDLETGEIRRVIAENVCQVPACSVSPDGRLIAAGSIIEDSFPVQIWEIETGNLITTLSEDAHSQPIQSISWSPDGTALASGSSDSTVRVWNVEGEQLNYVINRHDQPVYAVAWSGDGQSIASGGDDMEVYLSDAKTGEQTGVFGHKGGELHSVKAVAWGTDSQKLVASLKSGTLEIIDFQESRPVRSLDMKPQVPRAEIAALYWHPTQSELSVSYDNQSTLWNTDTDTSSAQNDAQICWSPDGELKAAIREQELIIWRSDQIILQTPLEDRPRRLVWNPQSNSLALQFPSAVHVWHGESDAPPTKFVQIDPATHGELDAIAWNWEGTRLVVGTSLGSLQIYDRQSGDRTGIFQLGERGYQPVRVRTIAWKPNSSLFAIETSHNYIFVFDDKIFPRKPGDKIVDSGIIAHDAHLRALCWSPNGKRLASASADRTVRIWNFDTETLEGISYKRTLTLPHASEVRDVAWNRDGRRLASLTDRGTVTLFDATLGYQKNESMEKNPDIVSWAKPGH